MTTLIDYLMFLKDHGVRWWSFQTVVDGEAYASTKKGRRGRPARAMFRIPGNIGLERLLDFNYILVGIDRSQLFEKFPNLGDFEEAFAEWKKKNKPPELKMCIYFMNDATMARDTLDEIEDEDITAIMDGEKFVCTNEKSKNYGVREMGTCENCPDYEG